MTLEVNRRIVAGNAERDRLTSIYGVTGRMVDYVMAGRKNSELARRIRQSALEMGCVEMVQAPTDFTWVEQGDQLLKQMTNGRQYRIDLKQCDVQEVANQPDKQSRSSLLSKKQKS